MHIQFVSDNSGKIRAVQLPLKYWKELAKKAKAFDLANSIRQGFEEAELIENGKLGTKTLEDLLNEL